MPGFYALKKKTVCLCLLRRQALGRRENMSHLNQLLLVVVLGWLFQVRTHMRVRGRRAAICGNDAD